MRLDPNKSIFSLGYLGKKSQISVFWNLAVPQLIEQAILNGEGCLSQKGALIVNTGKFTGRSPNDKYIVNYREPDDDSIDWGKVNQPFCPKSFQKLLSKVLEYLENRKIYVQDVYAGSHPLHQRKIRIITEYAWSALFAKNLLRPAEEKFIDLPDFTVIQTPLFLANPENDYTNSSTFILIDFKKKIVLIGNTEYAGEVKKAVFTVLNRLLPSESVLPMHCSANISMEGETALFFGLSGTGKTTLSSDPDRYLIGDDEHGWAEEGIFNFENGCYAKTINLSQDLEPVIWKSSQEFGAILENVKICEETRLIDFSDGSITENTRAAYPLESVIQRVNNNVSSHPKHIFFLSADAFGVLPPISKLSLEQAIYFFLSGYTAKLAGTERDLDVIPQATFSACFGAPFMPLPPVVYANMLKERIEKFGVGVWLVNTGWTGGPYGVGTRIKLPYTRAMISAALKGILNEAPSTIEDYFGLRIPKIIWGVPTNLLSPVNCWKNVQDYQSMANILISKFRGNFKQYISSIDKKISEVL